MFDTKELIGKTELQARKLIISEGLVCRLKEKDEITYIGTCDYKSNRVNLVVKNNKVIDAFRG